VPAEVVGVAGSQCLVFLGPADWDNLPEVPPPPGADDDLPYICDLTSPKLWVMYTGDSPFTYQWEFHLS